MLKYGLKAKDFIPVSFNESTGTQYTTWMANVNFLFWALERKKSELFVALKLWNYHAVKWTFIN